MQGKTRSYVELLRLLDSKEKDWITGLSNEEKRRLCMIEKENVSSRDDRTIITRSIKHRGLDMVLRYTSDDSKDMLKEWCLVQDINERDKKIKQLGI